MSTHRYQPKRFALCYRANLPAGAEQFAIHAAGCADLVNERDKYGATITEIEAADLKEAMDALLDPDTREIGWGEEHVRVFPCVRSGPKKAKALDPSVCPGTGKPFREDPWVPSGRKMYCPCSVCGKRLGTARGVAPRHKKA